MTAPGPITRASLQGSPKTLIHEETFGEGGIAYEWRCDRYPRLVMHFRRAFRSAKPTVGWSVDDYRCRDLDEAIAFLNGPELTDALLQVAS